VAELQVEREMLRDRKFVALNLASNIALERLCFLKGGRVGGKKM
jgi:hypothetical protein